MSKAIRYNSNFFDRYAVAALRGTLSVGFASLHPRYTASPINATA